MAGLKIDVVYLARQLAWSLDTFGPGRRTNGILNHIRKELVEIEENPTDIEEWADVVILALDGAWRAGYSPAQILQAITRKQSANEARDWPDWRTLTEDDPIEHIRVLEG